MTVNTAEEIIKHMYAQGYDAFEDETRVDTADEMIALINNLDEASIRFEKHGEKTEYLTVVGDVDPDETAADFTTGGVIEKKWEALNE